MGHDHLLEMIVGRSVGGGARKHLVQGIRRKRNHSLVSLHGMAAVDRKGLELGIIDDEGLAVEIVDGIESIDLQLFVIFIHHRPIVSDGVFFPKGDKLPFRLLGEKPGRYH